MGNDLEETFYRWGCNPGSFVCSWLLSELSIYRSHVCLALSFTPCQPAALCSGLEATWMISESCVKGDLMYFLSLPSCLSGRAQEQIENLRQRLLRSRAGMRGDGEGRPDLPLHRGRGAQQLLHRHLPPRGVIRSGLRAAGSPPSMGTCFRGLRAP